MQGHEPVHIHWTQTNVYLCWCGPFYISWLATLQAKCRLGMTFIVLYFFIFPYLQLNLYIFWKRYPYLTISLPILAIHLLYSFVI